MSEEELEQDELDGADEDDGEELAAADDGEADSSDGDEAPPRQEGESRRGGRGTALGRSQAEERDALAKAMENSFPAVERCGDRRQRGGRSAEAGQQVRRPPHLISRVIPRPATREWRALCYGACYLGGHLAAASRWRADLSPVQARLATGQGLSGGSATVHIVNRSCLPSRRSKRRPGPILHLPESEL